MTSSHQGVTRVLLVEDDVEDARLTSRLLNSLRKNPFDWVRVATIAEALPFLDSDFADVALLDLQLPDSAGLETLITVHRHKPRLPIVVLTGLADEETALAALQHGAQDYLVKDGANGDALVRAVRHAIRRQQLVTELSAANELLEQSNRDLARLCDTAQQFVDDVSHEFRTPLTVIREFSSLLFDGLAGSVNEQQREYLNIVIDRTDALTCMVDDMLDVSKLEAGLLSLRRSECRLETIVGHVAPMLVRKAEISGLTLSFEVAAGLPALYCDEEKIGRVITNLVVNAVKFTPAGGTVRVWARAEGPTHVLVGVTDDGPGIAKDDLATIFERFKQADCQIASSTKGFGLGLAIVKELVERNLGEIAVESRPGVGSTFSFTIPFAQPENLIKCYLARNGRPGRAATGARTISLLTATVGAGDDTNVGPVVDEFLHSVLRADDLMLRVSTRRWLILADSPRQHLPDLTGRVQQIWSNVNRNRPVDEVPRLELAVLGTWPLEGECAPVLAAAMAEFRSPPADPERPRRLLIVDDEREIVRSLTMRLEAEGYQVDSAGNGEDGLKMAFEKRPDAIILDSRMPGTDGLATLARLRERKETRETPVVVLSACTRDQQRALDLGARYYLQKPCDSKTLLAALKSALSQELLPEACIHEA